MFSEHCTYQHGLCCAEHVFSALLIIQGSWKWRIPFSQPQAESVSVCLREENSHPPQAQKTIAQLKALWLVA